MEHLFKCGYSLKIPTFEVIKMIIVDYFMLMFTKKISIGDKNTIIKTNEFINVISLRLNIFEILST